MPTETTETETTQTQSAAPKPSYEGGVSGWMAGLQKELPNPDLGGSASSTDGETPSQPGGTGAAPADAAASSQAQPAVQSGSGAAAATKTEETTEAKWPRTAAEWKKFKEARAKEVEERDHQIKTLTAELSEIKARAATPGIDPKEFESLKKEYEVISDRLRTVDVAKHPKFEAYFNGKTNAQTELAKRIVGSEKSAQVEKLLKLPDSDYKTAQLDELMLELSPIQQSRLGGVLNALTEIEAERDSEIAKGRENYERIMAQNQESAKQLQASREKLFEDTIKAAQDPKTGIPVFQMRDGDEKWNSGVKERIAKAKELLFGNSVKPDQVVRTALDAIALPLVLQDNLSLRADLEKAQKQVAELSKAQPRLEGQRPDSGNEEGSQPVRIKHGSNPMEATSAWLKNMTATRNAG